MTNFDFEIDKKWNGYTGKINIGMLQKSNFPPPADNVLIIIVGPVKFEMDI